MINKNTHEFRPDFTTFHLEDDETEYNLIFDFNHVCLAEELFDVNLMGAISGRLNMTQTRALVWACMHTGHPQATIEEVGALLTRDRETVLEALALALARSEKLKEAKKTPKPAAADKKSLEVKAGEQADPEETLA